MSLFEDYFSIHTDDRADTATNTKPRGFLREATIKESHAKSNVQMHGPLKITTEEYNEIIKESEPQLEFLDQPATCSICKTSYTRKYNIGFMTCRWHPNPGYDEHTFRCCGQASTTIGCKPCDHNPIHPGGKPRWTSETDTEIIPLAVAIHLKIPRSNYTVEPASTYKRTKALIKRCVY